MKENLINISLFIACNSKEIVFDNKTFIRKDFVKYLKNSGLAEQIIASQPSSDDQTAARMFWDFIQADEKTKRGGPRNRISEQELRFKTLLPSIDLQKKPKIILDKLSKLGLDIEESSLKKYLKKYRVR